jgi:hypothetical protein
MTNRSLFFAWCFMRRSDCSRIDQARQSFPFRPTRLSRSQSRALTDAKKCGVKVIAILDASNCTKKCNGKSGKATFSVG